MRCAMPCRTMRTYPGLPNHHGGASPVPITQRELADAVGSTREVVARALRDLRACGLIATTPRGVQLLDADELSTDANAAYFL